MFASFTVSQAAVIDTVYYQVITNMDGSLTFKNKNTGSIILDNSPEYYLNYIQGGSSFIVTNNVNVVPGIVTNGNLINITAIDDTNAFTKITHQYELNKTSPTIKYTASLQYKQNVKVVEERFDFSVPSQNARVMTRDMSLVPFQISKNYWSDLYTPKVIKFNNGLSFMGSDTMESMELQTSGTRSLVSFYSDYKENHPHFHYFRNGGGQWTYMSESERSINDIYSASINFIIDPSTSPMTLIKTRQPYGYDATLTLTNHADLETVETIKAVAYGTEDETDPDYGKNGVVGRGIGWTKSIFVSGCTPPVNTDDCYSGADLDDPDFKSLTDKLYHDGVEIVGHSITPETDSRSAVSDGMRTLSQYGAENWIDHGANDGLINWEDLASQGAIKGDVNYVMDIFDQHNYKYAWSYIDLTTTNYNLNMLQPGNTELVRPFFFYNNQVDNNVHDDKQIYLWSTIYTGRIPDLYYTNSNVDSLINERGMHIGHEYLAFIRDNYVWPENHAWYMNDGKIEIYPEFDAELSYIAGKKENGLLWSTTMSAIGDYLVSLKDISITYNGDGTYTINNSGSNTVTGITLLAEDNIRSVTIDEKSLVSFGGHYGNKEIVLPTLAGGQYINLKISYGTKDTSVPTITSIDVGKNKVNEITGVWNAGTRQLTMTASGTEGNHYFTVKIPALADRTITVKDITLGTTLGSYQASSTGEITFPAQLGYLHTFIVAGASSNQTPNVTDPAASHEIPDDTDKEPLWGETAQLNVTVDDDNGIADVTVDLSRIGGSIAHQMINIGDDIWSATTNASAGTQPGTYDLPVNATNVIGGSNTSVIIKLKVLKNGDITGNGATNIGDALRLANNISLPGNPTFDVSSKYVADVNGNGVINIGDALRLANNVSFPGNPIYILK